MISYTKLLILFTLALASCTESPVIQRAYSCKSTKKNLQIEGYFIGLEEMDHFNAMELRYIEHELVDDTKAKAKILGSIEKIEGNTILLKGDSLNFFYAVLEEPLTFNDSLLHRHCILQGRAQMEDSTKVPASIKPFFKNAKRILRFETRAAIILK
ncbi:MAG: hypothetical protein NT150_01100 [Bacteroidetes bacterium]|nr:hypothetical protein [Bacteroidota bacterium]